MRHLARVVVSTIVLGLAAVNVGCGESDQAGGSGGASDGSGGQTSDDAAPGSGGRSTDAAGSGSDQAGSGGQWATGGRTSTGGHLGSGGQATGGAPSTGGQPGSGGQAAGGAPSTGGQPGSGGSSGGGGAIPDAATNPDSLAEPDVAIKLDAPPPFWPQAFVANCTPRTFEGRDQSDGHHHAGDDCMTSGCHSSPADGSAAPVFLFGGTVYKPVATPTPHPGVEVGVRDTEGFYSACSASNGNFWYVAPGDGSSLTWSSATTRLRNANGEAFMMANVAAGCNTGGCHDTSFRIISPF